jgi:hypothetical protein
VAPLVDYVFRAARNKNWIKPTGIQQRAFFRRPVADVHGLSVDWTFETASVRFNPCLGIIKINVSKLKDLGLHLVEFEDHANICEVPYYTEETMPSALAWADAIISCCEPV